ncbi:hypothetical protein F511_35107 [Dorcoceras hygrometricum]|uniref:Uncharacterized protein n=1 Tax=Dorcoceras hygrometricum TaxID=472368 RepID=A0A2Z7D3M4_9LAMI|nr:hypothetical protein F511_35107 [Dorcoceras hygrometricum]
MEHTGMVRMFKTIADTRLHRFLEGTTYVFESVVVEFFSNARVIAGTVVSTVCGQKLVITEETFFGTFKLPTEGMTNSANISKERITEMRTRFSATEVPFKSSGKKKELIFEYRLLHDIVAKFKADLGASTKLHTKKHQQSGCTGVTIATQPDSIPATTTEPNKVPADQILPEGGADHFDGQMEVNAPTEQEGHNDQDVTTDNRDGSHHNSIPVISNNEVCLKEISSFESMVNNEEQLLEWAETPNITELSERRSLIQYKLLELELEKLYLMHLVNLKAGVASVNYYFECIRRLHTELRLIAAAHRHHRGLVGLPFITPESDFLPKKVNEATTITSHEHHAHKNEPLIQTVRHARQDHDEQGFIERVDQALGSTPISVINPEAIPSSEHDVSHYQDPDFSNLQLNAIAPQVSPTIQLLNTATQSLNVISTHVSSLDQSCARLRDDTTITRHHTTKLHDELKSTAEEFDIRIDVLERTLTQRMVDELAVVKSQLADIVEDLKETGAAKKGEGGSSSRPRDGMSGG